MDSSLEGRLRNIHLPHSKGLMPVYEAVVNSIESIEELNAIKQLPLSEYQIDVEIIRDGQISLEIKPGPRPEPEITSFRIADNGIGFTDDNWTSFNTLDSLKKLDKGCRGIGRVLWLKAFDNVAIDSSYNQDGTILRRRFNFNISKEISTSEPTIQDADPPPTPACRADIN